MQFSNAIIVAFLAATAYSQSVADLVAEIPTCAVTCLATAATGAGCGISDYECQCADIKAITSAATPCVLSGCKGEDPIKTLQTTQKICTLVAEAAGGEDSPSPTKPDDVEASVQPSVEPSVQPSVQPEAPTEEEPTETEAPVFTGAAGQLRAGSAMAAVAIIAALAL